MKNSAFHKFLLFSFVISLTITSCKKYDKLNPDLIKPEVQNDYKFLGDRLKQFAVEIAPVIKNNEARAVIVAKAKQKFDEEYEVLIKDLFTDSRIASLVSIDKSNKLHEDLLKRSGERLYPQIYIPHYQFIEDYPSTKGSSALRTEEDPFIEDPVLVFYSGNAEVDSANANEVWPGYKLVGGQLQFYIMVDEAYANEHEVWVFSLNETVNSQGRVPVPCDIDPCGVGCPLPPEGCGGGGGGGGTGSPDDDPTDAPAPRVDFPDLGHNKINFKIQYMRLRDLTREHWIAGAAEVSIRAKLVCHNGRKEGVPGGEKWEYSSDQYSNLLGKLIKKIKRKQIKDQELLTLNYPLQTNWQNEVGIQDPVHFIYTIFERDIFPSTKHIDVRYALNSLITNETAPGPFNLYYRSQDNNGQGSPYARYFFTNTTLLAITPQVWAGSGLVENASIAFNTVIY